MKRPILILVGGILVTLGAVWLYRNSRAATLSAPYTLVDTDGPFELRDYPALTLATTTMENADNNSAFRRLFQFITGKNTKSEQIPMTTPVIIDSTSGQQTMSFVLPPALVKQGAPEPADAGIRLVQTEAGRYAVLRFEGNGNVGNRNIAIVRLHEWLSKRQIPAKGEPVFAFYDPPWTPVFLRRNEVMIPVPAGTKINRLESSPPS